MTTTRSSKSELPNHKEASAGAAGQYQKQPRRGGRWAGLKGSFQTVHEMTGAESHVKNLAQAGLPRFAKLYGSAASFPYTKPSQQGIQGHP